MKTQSRRDFLRISTAGTLGALMISPDFITNESSQQVKPFNDPKSFNIGLQLYTIREEMKKAALSTLKKVANIGFKQLELADYDDGKFYGFSPAELKKIVNDLGMEILSSHANFDLSGNVTDFARKTANDHSKLGVKYCVQPHVDEKDRKTIAGYQKMAFDWNQVGRVMKEYGIQFGYHNHNFEFDTIEGKVPYYDVLMEELESDLVTLELDLFWAIKAGQNPVEMFNKYPGRFQLFHMKDMYKKQPPVFKTSGISDFAPVGSGVIGFKTILAARDTAGLKYMIVEQDSTKDGKPFEALQTSMKNLTTKLLV